MRHACFTGWHLTVALALGLPALLLFCIGIPLVVWLHLLLKRKHLDSVPCKQQLGYAYKTYKLNCWWEGPLFQLKLLVLLLVIVNGRPLGVYLPALITLCLLCLEHMYQQVLRPMRTRELQQVQLTMMMLLIYSVIAGLISQDYEHEASKAGLTTAAILIGVAHCLFVVCILYAIGRKYKGTAKEVVAKISTKFDALKASMRIDMVQRHPGSQSHSARTGHQLWLGMRSCCCCSKHPFWRRQCIPMIVCPCTC